VARSRNHFAIKKTTMFSVYIFEPHVTVESTKTLSGMETCFYGKFMSLEKTNFSEVRMNIFVFSPILTEFGVSLLILTKVSNIKF
jgi:hypothetical protein